jgi:hypothetical protein
VRERERKKRKKKKKKPSPTRRSAVPKQIMGGVACLFASAPQAQELVRDKKAKL